MKHHFENHDLVTEGSPHLVDVTGELEGVVERAAVTNGMALVYTPHTTCAIVINELEDGIAEDIAGTRVFFCELDSSRERKVFFQVIGE